jgi:hypothetical protein
MAYGNFDRGIQNAGLHGEEENHEEMPAFFVGPVNDV